MKQEKLNVSQLCCVIAKCALYMWIAHENDNKIDLGSSNVPCYTPYELHMNTIQIPNEYQCYKLQRIVLSTFEQGKIGEDELKILLIKR